MTKNTKKAGKRPKRIVVGRCYVHVVRGPDAQGRWYWRAVIYVAREQKTIWTGWSLESEVAVVVAKLVADGSTGKGGRRAGDAGTVQYLLDTWRADLAARVKARDLEHSTEEMYRVRAEWLAGQLGDVRCTQLHIGTLDRYRDTRLGKGAAPATVAAELNALRIAWNWGRERGLCPDHRLPLVAIKARAVRPRHTPDKDEVRRVLAQLDGWALVAARVYAATGARISEVAHATWTDLDEESRVLRIRDGTGRKTGAREIPLNRELVELLVAWRAGGRATRNHHGFEWGAEDAPILGVSPKTVRVNFAAAMRRACAAAKVERFTPHGFRRFVEDALAEAEVDVRIYVDVLGHSPATALRVYRKSTPASRRRAIAAARLGTLEDGEVIELGARRQQGG